MLDKIKQLQEEHDNLENEISDIQGVLKYLIQCNNGREQSYVYTDRRDPEQKFEFKGTVDGKEVSVLLNESYIMKLLEDNPKVDKLRELKIKIGNIEKLLEE